MPGLSVLDPEPALFPDLAREGVIEGIGPAVLAMGGVHRVERRLPCERRRITPGSLRPRPPADVIVFDVLHDVACTRFHEWSMI
jgi:hypothetical protein